MYPKPYIDYLVHFHGLRDYFECHEILEEFWKEDDPTERNPFWVGLIQVAVALYHQRRENFKGAQRMMESAIYILKEHEDQVIDAGLHREELFHILHERLDEIEHHIPYDDLNLPIEDSALLTECQLACEQCGCDWGADTDFTNEFIIHKHRLRDRSDVILERQKALYEKSGATR